MADHKRIVKSAYSSSGAEFAESPVTHLESGTPQGCPLSPVLWILIHNLALVLARIKFHNAGYPLTSNQNPAVVQIQAYADDTALFDTTLKST